ncbi:MAG: hypothetical protein QOD53_1295 [Thermoleophilaceae bacterium]|jgi:hypothetical protein|nr:hypothetical protein [Thermoleophilaceae bacterium]
MPRTEQALFSACRAEAESMLAVGESLEAVERMLDEAPLSGNDRDALWLFAWSVRDRVAPRRRAGLRLVPS